ncbi:hypothetical protein M8J76_013625 [Diaphorina citri]|nr:hypothetical protein M8J76_013625 [Diaphorina citri]
MLQGLNFSDNRGKHSNRPHKAASDVCHLAKEHLLSIPHKQSHYAIKKSSKKYFENPNLSVKKLFNLFSEYYREKSGKSLNVGYRWYCKFYKTSGFSIRQPRSDVCDTCTESEVKLKSNPNDPCKVSYAIHQRRIAAYKVLKNEYIEKAKENGSKLLVLEFDYAQNLPLPKITATAQFYKRLLWLYLFNVHCHNDGTSNFYHFLETEGKKDPSSVCSFLNDFITHKIETEDFEVNKIIFLSDGAGGQNKNQVFVKFCSWLAMKFKVDVTHLFPVRGHSYNQCDRNFGLYSQKLKKMENIYTVDQYLQVFQSCRESPLPFKVVHGANLLKTWASALGSAFSKLKPVEKGGAFKIQSYCRLMYKQTGSVMASQTYNNYFTNFRFAHKPDPLSHNLSLTTVIPNRIKAEKEKDIRSLFRFLEEDVRLWFETVLQPSENETVGERSESELDISEDEDIEHNE